jgi:hypothetical protein
MSVFPPISSPRAAFRDLRAFLRQRGREKVWAATMAVLITLIIVIIFMVDAKVNTAPPPRIVYVESYAANRTDADIIADQKKDQAQRDAFKKEKQRQFKQLEKTFHIE